MLLLEGIVTNCQARSRCIEVYYIVGIDLLNRSRVYTLYYIVEFSVRMRLYHSYTSKNVLGDFWERFGCFFRHAG